MGKHSIPQSVAELIEPALRDDHLDLVDVEYKKEGKNWYLRVYIDKSQGVTVEDCQKASRRIEDMIEIDELIAFPYILEVSSPGLDRPLKKEKDFIRSLNRKVKITTYSPIDNQRNFTGTIKDFKDGILAVEIEGAIVNIPLETIAHAKPVIEF